MLERERCVVAVTRSNGAWLIHSRGAAFEELTPIEQFDAASSLRSAKRLAVEYATEGGYVGPFKWEQTPGGSWYLSAMYDEEAVRAEGARAHARAYGYPDDDDDDEE